MKKYILSLLLFSFFFVGISQNSFIDSIKVRIATMPSDSNKINSLQELSRAYMLDGFVQEAKDVQYQVIDLAEKVKLSNKKAAAYAYLATMYHWEGLDSLAIEHLHTSIQLLEKLHDKKGMAYAYEQIANIHAENDNLVSVKSLYKAYDLYEEARDTVGMGGTLAHIGFYYSQLNNFNEAEKEFLRALDLLQHPNHSSGIPHVYMRLGQLYRNMGQYQKSLSADSIAIQLNRLHSNPHAIAWTHASIGRTLARQALDNNETRNLDTRDDRVHEAMNHYTRALFLFDSLDYGEQSYAVNKVFVFMGEAYMITGNTSKARYYLEKSLKWATPINHIEILANAHEKLTQLDSVTGNFESAFDHYKNFIFYQDSLNDYRNIQKTLLYKIEYEAEKSDMKNAEQEASLKRSRLYFLFIISGLLLLTIFFFWNNRLKQKARLKIEKAYTDLKNTQTQLIHAEKMASLGELTAGIAHEIQNPLNFVNNFSEVNKELLGEMNEEIEKGNLKEVKVIANNIIANEEKINHHGKRADAIVKGMLMHSRNSNGVKELTDINALADEYLRLAYHGLRAKDKSFNAKMITDFDESIGLINVIPQDIGRVILNLITNAFYAVSTPQPPKGGVAYEPTVLVTTKKQFPLSGGGGSVEISVKDNGNGIPSNVIDKIFQPFFTTKPTGQGTGLGLSLSYDIVKAHGGEMKVQTKEGEGSEFIIQLPIARQS